MLGQRPNPSGFGGRKAAQQVKFFRLLFFKKGTVLKPLIVDRIPLKKGRVLQVGSLALKDLFLLDKF